MPISPETVAIATRFRLENASRQPATERNTASPTKSPKISEKVPRVIASDRIAAESPTPSETAEGGGHDLVPADRGPLSPGAPARGQKPDEERRRRNQNRVDEREKRRGRQAEAHAKPELHHGGCEDDDEDQRRDRRRGRHMGEKRLQRRLNPPAAG